MAFGPGAGPCFDYLALEETSPTRWFNCRTARLEEGFRDLTGAALQMRTFAAAEAEAWEAARTEVDAGNPVLLLTDIYHLDHYGNSAHFPGHAVILAGYENGVAHLSDTAFEELEINRLENLARARHSGHPCLPAAGTHVHRRRPGVDRIACEPRSHPRPTRRRGRTLSAQLRRVLRPARGELRAPCRRGRILAEVAEDWRWCARFGYQVIERRGTGGGAFRLMTRAFSKRRVVPRPRSQQMPPPSGQTSPGPFEPPVNPRTPTRTSGKTSTEPPAAPPRPSTSSGPPSANPEPAPRPSAAEPALAAA